MKTYLTIADLDAMPDDGNRYELIEGEIYMSRAPGLTHQRVLRNLMETFLIYLAQNPIGEVLPGPGIVFDEYNSAIPDMVFLSHERRDEIVSGERLTGAPELVVEILSPGTENERRDRNIKRRMYAVKGVEEYWIVAPEIRQIEIYRKGRQGLDAETFVGEQDEITSPVLPGFRCGVSKIFDR